MAEELHTATLIGRVGNDILAEVGRARSWQLLLDSDALKAPASPDAT